MWVGGQRGLEISYTVFDICHWESLALEFVLLLFPDFLVTRYQSWYSGLLHAQLLLWDYNLWELTLPASLKPNWEFELPFFSFLKLCFLFHFSQDLELSYSCLCAQFFSGNSLKNSLQTIRCKLYFLFLPLFTNAYLSYWCQLCCLFNVMMASNLMCQRPSLLLFHDYLHFNKENSRNIKA